MAIKTVGDIFQDYDFGELKISTENLELEY